MPPKKKDDKPSEAADGKNPFVTKEDARAARRVKQIVVRPFGYRGRGRGTGDPAH